MIKTIYQFGQQLQKMESMKRYFEIFGSPYPERTENEKVIVVEIKAKQFFKLSLDDYRKTWNEKYLFRELAAARSTSIVPTLHFYNLPVGDKAETRAKNEKDLEDSVEKFLDKLKRSFDANTKIYEVFFDAQNILENLKTDLKDFVMGNCNDKKNYLFTLKIDEKWVGEIPEIKKILEDEAYNKYFSSGGEDFKSDDKICAVTYQKADEVWGRVDTLGFTVNDIAFSRNGFEASDSYKMFPVSPDAVKILEGTRRALDNGLSYGFQNLKFFVLPRFIAVSDEILRGEIVETFVQGNLRNNSASGETQTNSIIKSENIFNEIIHEEKLSQNSIYYDIFFYEQIQKQFSIKLHVSDVLPSRFKTIIVIKKVIEDHYNILTIIPSKKQDDIRFNLTFYELKKYFPEPFFFQIMEAIFYKTRINKHQVLAVFMEIIKKAFKDPSDMPFDLNHLAQSVKRTFVIYQYFQKLKLFGDMENQDKAPISMVAENFVEQHAFFDNNLKKSAFYLGCASEILLSSQRKNLGGNEPFALKLYNLNVGYTELKDIFPKLMNKAMEYKRGDKLYNSTYFDDLMRRVGDFLHDDKNVAKTDTSYAFSLGLIMEKEFANQRYKDYDASKKEKEAAKKLAETQK
jgi:CRISPR-associated protein Csh1